MRLIEEWKWEASSEALNECLNGNDTEHMRSLITCEDHIFQYCHLIKDRKEMWMKLIEMREEE